MALIEIDDGWLASRKVEIYEDEAGEWRWHRIVKRGGRIVAESGEGYKRQNKVVEAAQRENPGLPVFLPWGDTT